VSSHILTELAEMCTSIGIIERGKLLYAGSIDDALAKTRAARGEGDRIRVTLETASVSASDLAAALAGEPRFARVSPEGRALVIDLAPGETSHHFVIETLLAKGARIAAFEPQEVKLEDAFLKLTTGALQ